VKQQQMEIYHWSLELPEQRLEQMFEPMKQQLRPMEMDHWFQQRFHHPD
jgi:hypothetical protein